MCCKQPLHAFAKKTAEEGNGEQLNGGKREPLHRHSYRATTYRVAV